MQRIRIPFDKAMTEHFGVSPNHGRKKIKEGKLPAPLRDYEGGRPYFTPEIIEKHLTARMAAREQEVR